MQLKLKSVNECLDTHSERLKSLGETKTDFDLQFEDFKSCF